VAGCIKRRISNNEMIAAIQEAHGLVLVAATRLGCSTSTIYRRADRFASVRDALQSAREEIVDLAEAKLYQAVQAGEAWAVTLVLRTLGRRRGYVERQELSGADGQSLEVRLEWVN
jgi:hypothetical protein